MAWLDIAEDSTAYLSKERAFIKARHCCSGVSLGMIWIWRKWGAFQETFL